MDERREMVSEHNALNREVREMCERLERMEAHEGDDGTPEDIDGQCRLVDEIHAKRQRVRNPRADQRTNEGGDVPGEEQAQFSAQEEAEIAFTTGDHHAEGFIGQEVRRYRALEFGHRQFPPE